VTPSTEPSEAPAPAPPHAKRPVFPLVVAGLGAAAFATGGVLLGVGLHQVPSNCSVSSKECAAAPGDPAFADAQAGTSLANIGLGVGLGGAAMLVGGLVWYFVQPATLPTESPLRTTVVQPFIGRESGGLAVQKSF
jgi:hypothetical protein